MPVPKARTGNTLELFSKIVVCESSPADLLFFFAGRALYTATRPEISLCKYSMQINFFYVIIQFLYKAMYTFSFFKKKKKKNEILQRDSFKLDVHTADRNVNSPSSSLEQVCDRHFMGLGN